MVFEKLTDSVSHFVVRCGRGAYSRIHKSGKSISERFDRFPTMPEKVFQQHTVRDIPGSKRRNGALTRGGPFGIDVFRVNGNELTFLLRRSMGFESGNVSA